MLEVGKPMFGAFSNIMTVSFNGKVQFGLKHVEPICQEASKKAVEGLDIVLVDLL